MQMKKSIRILLIVATSSIGVGILFVIVGILTGAKNGMTWDTAHGVKMLESQKFTYDSGPLNDVKYIDIDVSNAKIQVLQSDSDNFDVQVNYEYQTQEPTVDTSGNRICVSDNSGWHGLSWNFNLFDFNWFDGGSGNIVTVYVPQNAKMSSIKLDTSNGSITSEASCSTDTLVISTSNGAVNINHADCGQSAEIKSSNGGIQCAGQFQGNTSIKTSNGKIEASGSYKGKTICKSSNSSIEFTTDMSRRDCNIKAETSNGNVRVNGSKVGDDFSENNEASNSLDLDTSNGSITLEFSH
jgi:hypothetical protein